MGFLFTPKILTRCKPNVSSLCPRLERELEELETGVSATSTKENLTDAAKEEQAKTGDNKVSFCPGESWTKQIK